MIDRAGQTWEFDDGTIVLVLRSRCAYPRTSYGDAEHDVLTP